LPITILGTREILPAKTLRLFPGRGTMLIHPAIETSGMSIEQIDYLSDLTRRAIASGLPTEESEPQPGET